MSPRVRTTLAISAALLVVLGVASGIWWHQSRAPYPDFRAYDRCLLENLPTAAQSESYRAALREVKSACRRLHRVEWEITELVERAPRRTGFVPWAEAIRRFEAMSPKERKRDNVTAPKWRDIYFANAIKPELHPDFEAEIKDEWLSYTNDTIVRLNALVAREVRESSSGDATSRADT